LNIESTQPASNSPEPVYPWFQVAWDIAQGKTGCSEEELVSIYADLASKAEGGSYEGQALASEVSQRLTSLTAQLGLTSNHLSVYSRKVTQTELATEIANALLNRRLRGYSRDGSLIHHVQSLGLLNPARTVFVRPSQVNRFLAKRGHNFQWNPMRIEDGVVSAKDFGKPSAGWLGQDSYGVETSDLAHAFNGIGRPEASWKKVLGRPPKWLSVSRCAKGKRGGRNREARWDPIAFGLAVKHKYKIPLNRIRARFQTIAALKPWLDRWKEAEAFYYPDE
jgi:hypothetical protein